MAVTVLIVDDHPSFRRFARLLLEQAGFSVVGEADDCASGLAAAERLRPQVILLDVMLPDGSGIEIAAALADRCLDGTRVVLTSSRSAADLGVTLEEAPVRGFIAKDAFTGEAFAELVEAASVNGTGVVPGRLSTAAGAIATGSGPTALRVVIADDAALLRQGIARLLTDAGMDVCGQAEDASGLMRLVEAERPDIAIVDIRMPPTHTDEGLVAARLIGDRYPGTGVLVLSQYVEAAYVLRLVEGNEGGMGYLLKDRVLDARELVSALERIHAGETVVDRELVDALLARRRETSPLEELTEREGEVLALMAEGLTDRGIAERLWVTPATVETHIRHILRKLHLPAGAAHNRRVHAVLTYLRT